MTKENSQFTNSKILKTINSKYMLNIILIRIDYTKNIYLSKTCFRIHGYNTNEIWNKSNTMCPTSGAETAYPYLVRLWFFYGVRVTRSLLFCRSLFVLLSFFFWLMYCLFFNLRILITSLWYLHALLTI
jgi:hypothetical protein